MSGSEIEDPAVSRFRDYLRIKTISLLPGSTQGPKPDYGGMPLYGWCALHVIACDEAVLVTECTVIPAESAVKFLAGMADEIGLAFQCIEVMTFASCIQYYSTAHICTHNTSSGGPREAGGGSDVGGHSTRPQVHHAQLTHRRGAR